MFSMDHFLATRSTNATSLAAASTRSMDTFTRKTGSTQGWADIFDSISDLILLHDDRQCVVRANRALSEKLRKHPAELLGLPVRDLFALSPNVPACPFCLDATGDRVRQEFRETKTGRTYLISSSRLRGIGEESQRVVHVFKDVTSSGRAERLYRELFDNIHEGAYFSSPDG